VTEVDFMVEEAGMTEPAMHLLEFAISFLQPDIANLEKIANSGTNKVVETEAEATVEVIQAAVTVASQASQ